MPALTGGKRAWEHRRAPACRCGMLRLLSSRLHRPCRRVQVMDKLLPELREQVAAGARGSREYMEALAAKVEALGVQLELTHDLAEGG